MTDLFGVPVNIGDKVAYTTGSQGNVNMEIGTILDIQVRTSTYSPPYEMCILRSSTGRKMSNPRGRYGIISLTPVQSQHPELFI